MPFKNSQNIDQSPSDSRYKEYMQENLQNRQVIYRDILVINDSNDDRVLTEDAPLYVDSSENVYFQELISYLRGQNLILPGSSIFFFDVERNVFVHQGKEPVTVSTMIPLKKFSTEEIKIKFRPQEPSSQAYNNSYNSSIPHHQACQSFPQSFHHLQSSMQGSMMLQGDSAFCIRGAGFGSSQIGFGQHASTLEQQFKHHSSQQFQQTILGQVKTEEDDDDDNREMCSKAIPREKRVKERKIGYVYDRVLEWRRYYEMGVPNENGRLQKVNLDIAASLVGLSRKTLDDYYKYIRKAEQFNFDFKGRADEKIGVLRNFVRDRQKRLNKHDLDEHSDEHSPKIEDSNLHNIKDDINNTNNVENTSQRGNENASIFSPGGGSHASLVNSERFASNKTIVAANLPPYPYEVQFWKDQNGIQHYADASSSSFHAFPNMIESIEEEQQHQLGQDQQQYLKNDVPGKIGINQTEQKKEQATSIVKEEYSSSGASPEDTRVEEEEEQDLQDENEEELDFLNNQEMRNPQNDED